MWYKLDWFKKKERYIDVVQSFLVYITNYWLNEEVF